MNRLHARGERRSNDFGHRTIQGKGLQVPISIYSPREERVKKRPAMAVGSAHPAGSGSQLCRSCRPAGAWLPVGFRGFDGLRRADGDCHNFLYCSSLRLRVGSGKPFVDTLANSFKAIAPPPMVRLPQVHCHCKIRKCIVLARTGAAVCEYSVRGKRTPIAQQRLLQNPNCQVHADIPPDYSVCPEKAAPPRDPPRPALNLL